MWPKRAEWLGIGIGFVGVALLSLDGNLQAQPIGVIAQFIAITCWAFGTAISRKVNLPAGGMGNAAEMLCGGAVLLVMALLRGETFNKPIEAQAVAAWLYLVTFGSLLAFSAYMHVVKHLRPAMASSYAYVNPVVAIAFGTMLAGEQVSPIALIAVGIILAGVVFMSVVKSKT